MTRPVINLDQLEFSRFSKGDQFEAERADISRRIGAEKLGYAVIRVPPGKRACPYHAHCNVEEMFHILAGIGTLRHAGEEYPVRAGDFICSPADPGQPHQLVNTSDEDLVYIALGTEPDTDVMLYPDSGKVGAWHRDSRNPEDPGHVRLFVRESARVDYWDGEAED